MLNIKDTRQVVLDLRIASGEFGFIEIHWKSILEGKMNEHTIEELTTSMGALIEALKRVQSLIPKGKGEEPQVQLSQPLQALSGK